MAEAAKPLWGSRHRGDLEAIKALGANHVRLYGNNPANSHRDFLDAARDIGLKVIVGMSDWPYVQSHDNCWGTNFNCFTQAKQAYLDNLRNGFLLEDGQYHPALAQVIAINEADLKLPSLRKPKEFCRGIISAIDGMLAAEKEAKATGLLINFTATFSFGICRACTDFNTKPSLGQMQELRIAFLNPVAYGYHPQNNLAEFYYYRFFNSFNTANPAADVQSLFLSDYELTFPAVPVVIQEYHCPHVQDQERDLKEIMNMARHSPLLQGVSFFEFQVSYDKGGSELDFGMFGLGDNSFGNFSYFGSNVTSFCLVPQQEASSGKYMPSIVAAAFGGPGLDYSTLCGPDPAKVPLDQSGYATIAGQHSPDSMAVFAQRIVQHLGGDVHQTVSFRGYIEAFMAESSSNDFEALVAAISKEPNGVSWDSDAACFADRQALTPQVGHAIDWICTNTDFNCTDIPDDCASDVWSMADSILSMSYNQKHDASPLADCHFGGAAVFGNTRLQGMSHSKCIVSGSALYTALTDEGYSYVLSKASVEQTAIFIVRVVDQFLRGGITDDDALWAFAENPPASLLQLREELKDQAWLCGVEGRAPCPTSTTTTSRTTTRTEPSTTSNTLTTTATPSPRPAKWSTAEGDANHANLQRWLALLGLAGLLLVALLVGGLALVGALPRSRPSTPIGLRPHPALGRERYDPETAPLPRAGVSHDTSAPITETV